MNPEPQTNNISLDAQIESFLFWKGEAVSIKEIAKVFEKSTEEIKQALDELSEKLIGRGIALIRTEEQVELRTAPAISALIEKLTKEELDKDLGKAGLETLSVILYEGPIARRDIDFIRGVNSQFIVRSLMVRGLVERVQDGRTFTYKPTTELLAHLGVTSVQDLPEFASYREELVKFRANANQTDQATEQTTPSSDSQS